MSEGSTWRPVQAVPVRYDEQASFSSLEELAETLCARLGDELGPFTALELFSALYAAVYPHEALKHKDVLDLVECGCAPAHRARSLQLYCLVSPQRRAARAS
jgi:hypothetical protein